MVTMYPEMGTKPDMAIAVSGDTAAARQTGMFGPQYLWQDGYVWVRFTVARVQRPLPLGFGVDLKPICYKNLGRLNTPIPRPGTCMGWRV